MKRQVLVLNQFALPLSGGGGTRHVELFGRLEQWDANIIAADKHYFDQSPVESSGIFHTVWVSRFSGNGLSRIVNWASYTATAFLRGLRMPRPDVVYGSSPHLGAALAGLAIAKIRRADFVLEVRDLWPKILVDSGMMTEASPIYRTLRWLERSLYRSADRIVILAEGSGPAIVELGIDPEKLVFIPNGADVADFAPSAERDVLRGKYGFDDFTAVYAGAHGPANGLDLVLDAAGELQREGVAATFVLVGDGVVKQALIERVAQERLRNVRFMDPVPKTEIPDLLGAADVGLHSLADIELFKTGVSPNKLYDYMAAGVPSLTNTGGDTAAMVERARSGVAVEPDGIAGGMKRLLQAEPSERALMGSNGQAFMDAERSRSAMAARLERMLDEVAG